MSILRRNPRRKYNGDYDNHAGVCKKPWGNEEVPKVNDGGDALLFGTIQSEDAGAQEALHA